MNAALAAVGSAMLATRFEAGRLDLPESVPRS
jgi:hypothetical protein